MRNHSQVYGRRAIVPVVMCGAALLAVAGVSDAARASVVTFFTPAGSMVGGLPVDAKATFTTSSNVLDVVLLNQQSDPTSVIQCLSDLRFTVNTGQTTGALISSSGLERTVSSGGAYSDGSVVPTGWELENSPLRLHVLGTPTAPKHTVIGPAGAGNLYNNANASIAGNGPHNPFLGGPISFSLSIPGLTSDATISAAVFSFGTTEGNDVAGVPEPASLVLLGLGAVLLRRRG